MYTYGYNPIPPAFSFCLNTKYAYIPHMLMRAPQQPNRRRNQKNPKNPKRSRITIVKHSKKPKKPEKTKDFTEMDQRTVSQTPPLPPHVFDIFDCFCFFWFLRMFYHGNPGPLWVLSVFLVSSTVWLFGRSHEHVRSVCIICV